MVSALLAQLPGGKQLPASCGNTFGYYFVVLAIVFLVTLRITWCHQHGFLAVRNDTCKHRMAPLS
jgi:hypothetical protein